VRGNDGWVSTCFRDWKFSYGMPAYSDLIILELYFGSYTCLYTVAVHTGRLGFASCESHFTNHSVMVLASRLSFASCESSL